ncbi:MAG: IclR family transcriptional regulator [Anaerolineae bacterium]|nr:MAG: IclR family transcriptional regulator [Anaerolineae bacterium]
MAKKPRSDQYNIRVVEKTIRVLRVLSDGRARTLTDISQEVDINTSTTFRLLATLVNQNFLEVDDVTGRYQLGFACLELARSYQTGSELLRVARPQLKKLRDTTKETVHLAALDGIEVVYLEKLEGLHAIGLMSSRVGRRAPAYCTGVGKALLSHIDPEFILENMKWGNLIRFNERTIIDPDELLEHFRETRRRGYALDEGEHEREVRCVAVPIFDQRGEAIAAVSVSGPKSRMDPIDQNEDLIQLTLHTAQEISERLGYRSYMKHKIGEDNEKNH